MDEEEREFDAFFQRHRPFVLAYLSRRTDSATADELTGQVLTVAWQRWRDVPRQAPLPWLYGVARNLLANSTRGTARAAALADRVRNQPGVFPTELPDPAGGICAALDVAAAFDRLPAADQEVLRLVAWELLDPAEAARALGCSRAAFAVRLHRARRRLRDELATEHEPAAADPRPREAT